MHLSNFFFNIILPALIIASGAYAQDDGPGFVTKCTTPGQVALTFDDGPSPFTPELLGYLDTAKVPATFFTLASSIKEGKGVETLKAAYGAGHQIALHSNTHADMNKLPPAQILDEYTINLKAVQDAIGVSPAMARPPFGNCNAACAKVLEGQMGLTVIQWNCDSNDWRFEGKLQEQPKLFSNVEAIINPSNPKTDSFITLQHDIDDFSVKFVPKIIDLIRAKGYEFVTVEQCLGGKVPAYKGVEPAKVVAPAPDSAETTPVTTTPSNNTASTYSTVYPAALTTGPANNSNSTTVSYNAANSVAPIFGLKLICLLFGYLMY